jgi:hypothetical protein
MMAPLTDTSDASSVHTADSSKTDGDSDRSQLVTVALKPYRSDEATKMPSDKYLDLNTRSADRRRAP